MLNVLTERGQVAVEQEREAAAIWHSSYPDLVYNDTPKDSPAAVDAIITRNGSIAAVVETKCRELDHETFSNTFDGKWLVTLDKMLIARDIAKALNVPLLGFLYLTKDRKLLWQKLWSPQDGWNVSFSVEKTKTKKNINGGEALRDNAFIDMTKANILGIKNV